MKVALLHYWLINLRGGEKVLAELASLYPEADIFTHACDPSKIAAAFEGHRIHETFIGKLPLAKKHCQKYLPLMPLALKQLNLDGEKSRYSVWRARTVNRHRWMRRES